MVEKTFLIMALLSFAGWKFTKKDNVKISLAVSFVVFVFVWFIMNYTA